LTTEQAKIGQLKKDAGEYLAGKVSINMVTLELANRTRSMVTTARGPGSPTPATIRENEEDLRRGPRNPKQEALSNHPQ
jgi:hypothetical protein